MIRKIFSVCLIAAASVAAAQNPADDEQSVVVTASRTPESLDNTLWSSTVITRADIEARQASSVQELLGDLAGINIVNNGGLGKVSNVLMRGTESEHTLLLIDGVRVASATAGTAPFELIPIEQIDRIEIVRGPRSTLYGTDAIGGVIQIFTRRAPRDAGVTFGSSVTGASRDTRKIAFDMQASGEDLWLNAGAEYFDTRGINSCAAGAATAFAACFTNEPDLDGYRSTSGSLAAGLRLNNGWKVEARSLITDGRTEFDGDFGNSADFAERVFALSVDGALGPAWHVRAVLGRDVNNQQNFDAGIAVDKYDTQRDIASVQLDGELNSALRLIAGVDYQNDEVDSNLDFARDSRSSNGVFGELHGRFGEWSTLAGARYEDNQQFGSRVTGNLGAGRRLGERHRITATWGTGFHAPTFNDLYFPFGAGNPALEPEESRSFDVGVENDGQAVHWSLHAFQTQIDELISLDSNFVPINVDDARIRGAELQADWRIDRWQLGGQYTRLDPVSRSDDNHLLPRRAKQSASLQVRRHWPSASLGMAARYEGRRFDDLDNTIALGSYVTLDLTAEQEIGRALTLQARIANLFDHEYSTAAFYLQDGRNYSVTLRYRFAPQR